MKIWELTDKQESSLRRGCESRRLTVDKKSWSDGYDLTKQEHIEKMVNEAKADPPWRIWASLTSSYQVGLRFDNSLQEKEHRKKKKYRAKKQLQGLIALLKALMDNEVTPHFYIEWPKEATECWGLEEIEQIKKNVPKHYKKKLYETEVDGCMFWLQRLRGDVLLGRRGGFSTPHRRGFPQAFQCVV